MRSSSPARRTGEPAFAVALTAGESTFRNAKLREAALIAYKAFADLAGKGSLFVITLVAARRLPPRAFGVFALGSTLGWILSVATDFGVQLHLARAVARIPAEAPRLLRAWLGLRIWSAVAGLAIVVAGLVSTGAAAAFAVPIAIFALVYTCTGLVEFFNYFYRGLSRSDVESSLILWQRGGTLVLGLLALVWWPDVRALALAMLVPAAAALAYSVRFAWRLAPAAARIDSPSIVSQFRRDVFPIGVGTVLSALYFRVDVLLVQTWAGTEAVARYNAVFKLIEALRLFPAAVLAVVLPTLCRAADFRPLARVSAAVTAFAIVAAAAVWTMAGWLVPFAYGAPYASAVPAFRILALSFPLLSLNFALTHQLVGWERQRAYAVICGLALVLNVALNARLIPALSIDGAAWSTLWTEVFLTGACAIALGRGGRTA
jgi:O-antigen/teichoic acid export membrane protein